MDYQEAIENHINECRHRIDVIRKHVNTNGDADTNRCLENIKVLETTISVMQELQEYKKIGTLEEVRDAVDTVRRYKTQYLDDMKNLLEPLKISSALKSEIMKLEFRKQSKPESISILDYTIIAALQKVLYEVCGEEE